LNTHEEVSIKVHCIVSCFSEVLRRSSSIDYRPFYIGVWDAPFDVTADGELTYYQHDLKHDYFVYWFERLFGLQVHEWYDRSIDQESNLNILLDLIENKPKHRYIIAQIDMSYMPERENKFHQRPFPHFLMLARTDHPDEWFMLDPDFRWEGMVPKAAVLEAFRKNTFGGGFYIDALQPREPANAVLERFYHESFEKNRNPLTQSLRKLVESSLLPEEPYVSPALIQAVKQLPVIAIRKYSYEHALMYFNERTGEEYGQFEDWCDRIEELVQGLSNIQYRAVKMAMTKDKSMLPGILRSLDSMDALELGIKQELHRHYLQWKQCVSESGAAI
jgi:petrobactin synthase